MDKTGRLDILVHCAGIAPSSIWTIEGSSVSEWRRTIDANLTSTFLVCRAAIPLLKENGWGSIVTICSQTAREPMGFAAHYATSKAGIPSFTKSIALEVAAAGIRVGPWTFD